MTHESHVDSPLWPVTKTHLIHCQFPTLVLDELECNDLHIRIERIVSVIHDIDLSSVLEIDIPKHYV